MSMLSLLILFAAQPALGGRPAADPWADEVAGHSAGLDGSGLYNDPFTVLGEPARTFYDPSMFAQFQVSLVAAPFNWDAPAGNKLIVSLPEGEFIKVKFDEPVEDDPRNPYGIDLLVFGNAFFHGPLPPNDTVEPDTDMATYTLRDGYIFDEPVMVAVSPTGIGTPDTDPEQWYVYEDGPWADSWFPTQAYDWDRSMSTWGPPKDFTIPVDPALGPVDFAGQSAADGIDLYEASGGGAGFDLSESGFAAIQYVYLSSVYAAETGEVDALADVFPALGDFDRDGDVDLKDFAAFQTCFPGDDGLPRSRECFPADFDGDRDVDLDDYHAFEMFLEAPH